MFVLVLALASISVARGSVPPCAQEGVAYKDPAVTRKNGGKPYDALACQMYCETTPDCNFFTYYQESKDCWLLGADAIMTPNVAGAVSGPEDCNHMREGSNVAMSEPNPLSKYPDVKVAPQSPEISERVAAQDDTDGVLAASSGGSDFPFGWVLGGAAAGLGVAGLGALLWTKSGGMGRSRKRTSRGVKVDGKDQTGVSSEDRPLMQGTVPVPSPFQPAFQMQSMPQATPYFAPPSPMMNQPYRMPAYGHPPQAYAPRYYA